MTEQLTKCCEPLQKLWFLLFYVLVFKNVFAVVIIFLVKVTEWPPIGKIAAHSA